MTYLQCDVVICDSQDPYSRCNQGCAPSLRKRRDVAHFTYIKDSARLSSGPMLVKSERSARHRRFGRKLLSTKSESADLQITGRTINKTSKYTV